jgi:predicted nucleic acid-binding protein
VIIPDLNLLLYAYDAGSARRFSNRGTLLETLGTAGNLVTDAQIAALAIEHDAILHTADSDFLRFSGLCWSNPLTGARSGRPRSR